MGCPDVLPGLRASPFWSRDMAGMEWVREVELNFKDIREVCPDPRSSLLCAFSSLFSPSSPPVTALRFGEDGVGDGL